MSLTLRRLQGAALEDSLEDLAGLRIAVFREWPYLYDGTLDYEWDYLSIYVKVKTAIVVAAFDGARMVGAATGAPLLDHSDGFGSGFDEPPVPLEQIFYCAESVLLPAYRGQGLGHRFFDAREDHARALGATYTTFCAVIRPSDHPLRPSEARDLGPFWRKRGYAPIAGAVADFSWKDVDQPAEDVKKLQFWGRAL